MNVLGVTAGNGVSLYSFQTSRHFKVVGNIEPRSKFWFKKPNQTAQWSINFNSPMDRSIDDMLALNSDFSDQTKVDIIVGHPDCGHSSVFSYSRAKKFGDAKANQSLNEFIESIHVFKPKVFLMENLPALLKQIHKMEWRNHFKDYRLIFHELSVSEFGNSQRSRIRLVLIGVHRDLSSRLYSSLMKVSSVKQLKSTRELLKNIPSNGHWREEDTKIVCMEKDGIKLDLETIRELWLGEYKELKKWPGKGKMKTLPGVYINRGDDFPMTVRPANRQFNPDGEMLTPREIARIQGIPDHFKFVKGTGDIGYYINKGRVTAAKTMPFEVGKWFKRVLVQNKKYLA